MRKLITSLLWWLLCLALALAWSWQWDTPAEPPSAREILRNERLNRAIEASFRLEAAREAQK
jgi:hypothetical protein